MRARAQSAARSKERKQRHIAELEHDKQLRDEELAVCLHQNAALQHDNDALRRRLDALAAQLRAAQDPLAVGARPPCC